MDHTQNLWHLPRGGLLISTSSGPVQFGVPPETIKDSMTIDIGVPAIFILPPLLFSMDQGISFSELEFPIYYNFFFRKRKIRVVCTQNQKSRVLTLLNEALFGPEKLDYAGEFINGQDTPGYPDLKAEMLNFRTVPVEGVVRPRHYKPGTTIFNKGDRGNFFYLVITGQVEIVDQGACLTTCGRSDFFGEKCLFSDGPRTAAAIAKSEARLYRITQENLALFVENNPGVFLRLYYHDY